MKDMTHPTPFEIADLISFYQSDNVMPKGETEEIAKAASLANYMWKKRTSFRTQSRSFKPPEDTIFRPVAPFNVFSVQEANSKHCELFTLMFAVMCTATRRVKSLV